MFDHSNAWKPFLYLKASFLPAVLAGSSCSCARKAMCDYMKISAVRSLADICSLHVLFGILIVLFNLVFWLRKTR